MEQVFDDTFFMKKALAEAQIALEKDEVPVGVVVVANNSIIALSHNLTEALTYVTAHAEMQGITAAANAIGGKYLQGCTLYVTLEPCSMCAGALYWSQISRVVFAADDPKLGYRQQGTLLHPKTEVVSGVMAYEALELLLQFFKQKRG